ncbi:MAG: hypothetical protein ABI333_24095 [bacterium]
MLALGVLLVPSSAGAYDWSSTPDADGLGIWVDGPTITQCCYKDRDCDHLSDRLEAELAWAFRPYVV